MDVRKGKKESNRDEGSECKGRSEGRNGRKMEEEGDVKKEGRK